MKKILILRVAVTLAVVAVALLAAQRLWQHYEVEPWTRDGRVRADIVQVAPDVSGLVTQVLVRDNQPVSVGTPLFIVGDRVMNSAVGYAVLKDAIRAARAAR